MSFRYLGNALHEQHNSKTKQKHPTYLVKFAHKKISLRYLAIKLKVVKSWSPLYGWYLDILKMNCLCKTIHRQDEDVLNVSGICDLQQSFRRYLSFRRHLYIQDVACQSSYPRCLLDILNKSYLRKTVSRQN